MPVQSHKNVVKPQELSPLASPAEALHYRSEREHNGTGLNLVSRVCDAYVPHQGTAMPKTHLRGNREIKKPKQPKKTALPPSSGFMPLLKPAAVPDKKR